MSSISPGLLILISGPSGVGKGTVINALKKRYSNLVFPLSCTTRARRPQEVEGEVYKFLTKKQFEQGIERGDFLEWARVHEENYYGILKQPILDGLEQGKILIREVDVQGFHSILKVLPRESLLSIFLQAEDREKLVQRIKRRGNLPQKELELRMKSAQQELLDSKEFDYQVWSMEGKIQECVDTVVQLIEKKVQEKGLMLELK